MLKWLKKLINPNLVEAEVVGVAKVNCAPDLNSEIEKAGYTEKNCGGCYHYLAKLPGKEKYWICKNWEYTFVRYYDDHKKSTIKRENNIFYKKYEVGDKIEVFDNEDESEFNGDNWERCDPWKKELNNDNSSKEKEKS